MLNLDYNPIILAVDVSDRDKMRQMVTELHPYIGKFKVGLEMFVKYGPEIVEEVHQMGGRVMLDLKLHDIPNTVEKAAKNAALLGVDLLTIHTAGGSDMMAAALQGVKDAAAETGLPRTKLLGITILTSLNEEMLNTELGMPRPLSEQVLKMAETAQKAGLDGVVSSPHEAGLIKIACGPDFLTVTPGIRLATSNLNDQKRVATPEMAIKNGASYIVMGRAITQAENPIEILKSMM